MAYTIDYEDLSGDYTVDGVDTRRNVVFLRPWADPQLATTPIAVSTGDIAHLRVY